ncbi:Response regulator receiver domain-containing protein [Desulfatibacillum alkenivorans DSM 16219]|jgi:DNA-binding NtrC family response regulator|uniref:Response regulator receiver domain-containing protein n=1 Tax=Desulfatibacillum alkenivorans DSM 16219 TaxID=1121393 RepID=A0A1M6MD17_9BACT|nr:response regulator [Desulfatibacillum alkenivorans]SHJ81316.1 Response regulator receiver domain-containing protein [Desulfatibacillum alkenivorans DSM 16219]
MKILIVDDDPIIILSCRRILEAEGHELRVANTVDEGESFLVEESFDLMITDIKMPGADGFEMIRRAGKARPEMPVLVMTGYLMQETLDEGASLGVTDYIAKPFTPDELLRAIEGV